MALQTWGARWLSLTATCKWDHEPRSISGTAHQIELPTASPPRCSIASPPSLTGTPGTTTAKPRWGSAAASPTTSCQDAAECHCSPCHGAPPSQQHTPAEPLWEPGSLQPEPQHLNIILGHREPLQAPVAGGDFTAHCLTNTACVCTAVLVDAESLCEWWVYIYIAPFAGGIPINTANITHLCASYLHEPCHTPHPPPQHIRPAETVRTTRGKVGTRLMRSPQLEFSQVTGAKPLLLWSCPASFDRRLCSGHFYLIWKRLDRTSYCVCHQKSRACFLSSANLKWGDGVALYL